MTYCIKNKTTKKDPNPSLKTVFSHHGLVLKRTLFFVISIFLFFSFCQNVRAISLSTEATIDINATYATANGTVVDLEGGTIIEHGHVWGTTADPEIVPTTPISHYKMNDNEATTTVIDTMGVNAGTAIRNTVDMTTAGKVNSALNFNGTNDYIYTTNAYTNPQSFSLTLWFKTSTASGKTIMGFESNRTGTSSSNHDRKIWMGSDGKIRFGWWTGSAVYITSGSTYYDNEWHFVVANYQNGSGSLYIDNKLQGTAGGTAQSYTGYWRIGSYKAGWVYGSNGYFPGLIDDVRIYDQPLSSDQVLQLYNFGAGMERTNVYSTLNSTHSQLGPMPSTGTYTSSLNGLTPNTTYYIRSYSIGSDGSVFYGNSVSFTTNSTGYAIWEGDISSDWAEPTNWSSGSVPDSSTEVIIDGNYINAPILDLSGGATTIKTLSLGSNNSSTLTLSYGNADTNKLQVGTNVYIGKVGVLTHTSNATAQTHVVNLECNNLTIEAGGQINVASKGYVSGYGPGAGIYANSGSAGASHGGEGGDGLGSSAGPVYGSITEPVSIGSGGGLNCSGTVTGGKGGGAVKLTVSGTSTIEGNIDANGGSEASGCWTPGAGSGGSIYLTTNALEGNGLLSVKGGSSPCSGDGGAGGGGGGGRIAVYYTTDNSTISYEAQGGKNYAYTSRMGGAGTIYKKAASQTHGDLIIDNNDQDYVDDYYYGKTPINETITFDDITLQNYGHLDVGSSANITYSSFTWSNQGVITDSGGTMDLLSGGGSLTVPATARLLANTARTFTGLTVEGTLTHSNNKTVETYKLDYTVNGDVTVASGGQINVQGKGFTSASGPGAGRDCGGYGSGAGHGGIGGVTADAGSTGGSVYDIMETPTLLGSGGGNDGGGAGSAGGGAIKITTSGTLTNNGSIIASANNATGDDGGGGSGGSIFLTTDTLAGEGSLSANGGNAQEANAGAGAGGRIALIYTFNSSALTSITVDPGSVGRTAEEGTVYPTDMYPTLSTQSATDITGNSATANGTIDALGNYGIIEHGHTWSDTETEPELVTPISHYKMNDNEATTTVIDTMGVNAGTAIRNTVDMTTAGKVNSALNFNGTNDYIYTTNAYTNPQSFSLTLWFKTSTASGKTIMGFESNRTGTSSSNYDRKIWMGSDGKIRFGWWWTGSAVYITSGSTYYDNEWHFVVANYQNGSGSLYIDNKLQGTAGGTAQSYTGYWRIGSYKAGWVYGSNGYFPGLIDDVRIYNQALNADQISQLYNSGNGTENSDPISSHSQLGSKFSTGTFQSSLTALDPLTTYYVRSYAQASDGQLIYGDVQTFDTTEEPQMDHLEITGNATQTAGQSQTITITAKDQYDNTYTGFTGDQQIQIFGAQDALDGTIPTFTDKDSNEMELGLTPGYLTFTQGIATTELKLYRAETVELEAVEFVQRYSTTTDPDHDLNITVTPATLDANETSLSLPANQTTAGTENPITITAFDQYQNPLTAGGATMVITITGANSATPVVTDNTDGTYSANYTPTQGGTDQITATANANPIGQDTDGTSDGTFNLTVSSSSYDPAHSVISVTPTPTTAGSEATVTVTLYDPYDNPLTSGGETILITVSGTNSATPTVTDNTDGTYTASYTPTIKGTDQITATINTEPVGQDTDGTSDGTFHLIIGSAEDMNHLEITGNSTQTAGQAQTITLTAYDGYDNVYDAYNGDKPITFSGANVAPDNTAPTTTDKDDQAITLGQTTTLTFTEGIATTELILYKTETIQLEATDGAYSTQSDPDYDLDITVAPADLSAEDSILSLPQTSTDAGTENPITITAFDQYQNLLTAGGATMVITITGANSATPVVTDNTDGTYSANYTPTQGGTDQITATANANPIGQDTDGTSDGTFNLTVIAPEEDTSEEQELSLADSADGQLSLTVNVSDQEEQEISFDSKDDQATKIKEISLKAKDDKEVKGDIKIKKKKSKPDDVVFPSQIDACTIYTLVNIETDFSDSDLKKAKVTFRIPKGWLKENKLQKLLFVQGDKAHKNKTSILSAVLKKSTDTEDIYQASSDTLDAYWAVYGCEETATETIAPTSPTESSTTAPTTPTTPVTQDIDQDGLLEEVSYTDLLPTYTDPDNSSQLIDTITTDNSPGLIIDTNGDDQGDILWQSQDQTTLPLDPIDLTGDTTPELLIDTDGDDQYDYYYSPTQEETQAINDSAIDIDNDGQTEHFFDLDQNDDHTQFIDPDNSSTVEAILDGDNDSNTDYLINTGDSQLIYYDPDSRILSYTEEKEVNGSLRLTFDTDGDGKSDRYLDKDYQVKELSSRLSLIENTQTFITENKTAAATAAYVGMSLPVVQISLQLSRFQDILPLLKEVFLRIIGFLGYKRRRRQQGIVYDAKTGQPLPLTRVEVADQTTGKTKEVKITDKYGSIFFLVPAGDFKLSAFKPGYQVIFPPQTDQYYPNTYQGETLSYPKPDKIDKNLSLQRTQRPPSFLSKLLISQLFSFLFYLGFLANLLIFAFYPSYLNFFILLVYLYLALAKKITLGRVKWGTIQNKQGKPVAFATVKLTDQAGQLIGRAITDLQGRYLIIANAGQYLLTVTTTGEQPRTTQQRISLKERGEVKEKIRV